MYNVNIAQTKVRHAGTPQEYTTTDDIDVKVSSAEDIETIVGLFGEECIISITYIKEDEENGVGV